MEKKQNQDSESKSRQLTECQWLELKLQKFQHRLNKIESEKENLYENPDFNVEHLNAFNMELDQINREINRIKTEQRLKGCYDDTTVLFRDTQTIISTSSVRRKDTRALEKIPHKEEETPKYKK